MKVDTNPYGSLSADIDWRKFELFCLETLKAYAEKEKLADFGIKHNQHIETHDGTYQIDILAEFTVLGTKFTMLIECKKYTGRVERKVVTELSKKIESIGANKGLIISTAEYQSGAVQFAEKHGISLWQIVDASVLHVVDSHQMSPTEMQIQLQAEQHLPKYVMLEWDYDAGCPLKIYPTEGMCQAAIMKARENYRD